MGDKALFYKIFSLVAMFKAFSLSNGIKYITPIGRIYGLVMYDLFQYKHRDELNIECHQEYCLI
ncbi:hypothetical protein NDM229_008380 [Acinetobacter bereziniae]|nr:hypothetical protein NDM229_008380 [Acinetobacter bereziniae]